MDNTLAVERRSIDVIPDSERHGSVRSLFTVWFSAAPAQGARGAGSSRRPSVLARRSARGL